MKRASKLQLLVAGSLAAALGGCGGGGSGRSGGASTVAPATSGTAPVSTSTTGTPGTTTPGTTVAPTPPKKAPVGEWLKGDFHVHSTHSGDADKIGDDIGGVIRSAEAAGLDFSTISDHRTTACLTDPLFTNATTKMVLIPGEEWGGPGHAGAHGVTRDPIFHEQDESGGPASAVQKMQATIDDVHSMGGVFIVNHPMDTKAPWMWPIDKFDGMEIWNQSWAFRSADDMTKQDADQWIANHKMSPSTVMPWAETFKALQVTGGGQNLQRLRLYDAHLDSGRHIAAIGGDSHYLFPPGYPTTQVFAATRTKADILDAVKKGHTQVARSPRAPQSEFVADGDGDGTFESIVGDSIPLGKTVTFRLKIKGCDGGKVELRRNGQVAQAWTINSADWAVIWKDTPTTRSWYRIDCWERLDLTFPHATTFRSLVLSAQTWTWLNTLTGILPGKLGSLVANAQKLNDAGGPAAIYLLLNAKTFGVTILNAPTAFPRLDVPENVIKVMNVAVHDQDYCPAVFTSPIWVE